MIIDQLKNVQSGFYPNLLSAQGGNPGLAQRIQAAFEEGQSFWKLRL